MTAASVRRLLALAAGTLPGLALGQGCTLPSGFQDAVRVESRDYMLAFRTQPQSIAIGKHFSVDAAVCAKSGAAPTALAVDAQMPEHRHGMNYRANVLPQGDGRFLAEGLMFHMPGRWQFVFDVESGGKRQRLTKDVVVE